ncbi:hypothetical protein D3C72_1789810 [compost metagenome]|jgi:hypothetical protein
MLRGLHGDFFVMGQSREVQVTEIGGQFGNEGFLTIGAHFIFLDKVSTVGWSYLDFIWGA